MRLPLAVLAATLVVLVVAAAAAADDDGDEVAVRTSCLGGSAVLVLRAEGDDDAELIEIVLRADVRRRVYVWRIALLHERRLLYLGTRRSTRPIPSLRLARRVPDWHGRQTVAARLTTGAGRTCHLEATI